MSPNPTCPDFGTGNAMACTLGPDVHDPADDLGCDRTAPCHCQDTEGGTQ